MPLKGPDGKRLSGAQQNKIKIERLQNAPERPPGWDQKQRAAYRRAIRGKTGVERDIAALQWVADWAVLDPGVDPRDARQQVIAAAQARAKAADPAAKLAEAMSTIQAQADRIAELEGLLRGRSSQSRRDPREGEGPTLKQ
jgi:hypothetical protein